MRYLIIFSFFVLLVFSATAQEWRPNYTSISFAFGAGASHGLNQKIWHHYPEFKRTFPGAKDQFWNPRVSWVNKYNSRFPVWFTDAHHLTNSTTQVTIFASGISMKKRSKKYHYILDLGFNFLVYSFGNYLTFNAIYKK